MDRNLLLGLGAALGAALIGAGWQIASRHGVTTTLGPLELAVLRYGVPALVLAPLLRGVGLVPRGLPRPVLAMLVLGGGLPFGLLALAGVQFAPAAHMGVFMAGCVPLFTALLGWAVNGEAIRGMRWLGLALVAGGVAVLGGSALLHGASGAWRGDLLFLLAAAIWAGYTLAFRRSGLTPWQGAALVNAWSALLLLPAALWTGVPKLAAAPLRDLLFQMAWQGLIAGVLGLVVYTAAVARLGPVRASLSGALVPPLTAFGAWALLGEPLGPLTIASALLVGVGTVLGLQAAPALRGQLSKR
jgi:drug/metabolite transporter (DMT)-like permease